MKSLFLRLFALPVAMSFMWIFYSNVGDDAKGFYSKSAMILNILGLTYGAGVWVTLSLCKLWNIEYLKGKKSLLPTMCFFPNKFLLGVTGLARNMMKDYTGNNNTKESRLTIFYNQNIIYIYSGTTLLLAYESVSLPFSIISTALSVCIIYPWVCYVLF